ncbi:PDZ domain-containing protein [Telmatocola sphagniphila]|uniref:PDZ domain-containing protein n=1 Tax=Telmatocola sphagniphila TaxID=1123043 RepID=A0A8E6B404_9BACT|nr:PDZ domain-containing protein [Telmatocola sphagniphila]QVL30153.1 PDZ domain-containing protein [Telmatocola sphagniphila]
MKFKLLLAVCFLAQGHSFTSAQETTPKPKEVLPSYHIPYKLTDTKHVMVRVKLNGKGPFNFILDTGAPALILSEKVAEKLGVKSENGWATFDKLEVEGGLTIPKAKGLAIEMFQLKGMNALGVAGVELHGVLGYTVLAQFEIQYDFTKDKLTWKALKGFTPADIQRLGGGKDSSQGGLEMIGTMMQTLGPLMGFKPNFETRPRGFLGVTLEVKDDKLFIQSVIPNSPAADAGLAAGDRIVALNKKETDNFKEAIKATSSVGENDSIKLTIERAKEEKSYTVKLGKGL